MLPRRMSDVCASVITCSTCGATDLRQQFGRKRRGLPKWTREVRLAERDGTLHRCGSISWFMRQAMVRPKGVDNELEIRERQERERREEAIRRERERRDRRAS